MFSNINKSAFGAGTSAPSFGFGNTSATNQAPFGQSQLFGKSTSTTGFGTTAPLFGSASQQSGTLFSTPSVPSFGANQQTGFGTGLFGQQQNTSGVNGLFGNTSGAAFGQQNKSAGFGFGANTATPLFGQQQPQNFQPVTSSGVFGNASGFGNAQMGTVIKFNPVTGTDTMQKSGLTQSISTKHHCITCMKEYEAKSLEELRWEDYQSNRRGPQQQNTFGASPFGAPASTAPSLFGQTENKPAFGQSSTFGGGNGFGMSNQQNQQSLFGKPAGAFGTTPTSITFGGGTATSGFTNTNQTFGTNTGIKPFGTQPTQNVFGTPTTQQSSFGTNFFGQTGTQNTNTFFNKPTQTGFNTQQPVFTFGQQTTAQNSLFQPSKPTTGFPSFGQTNLTSTSGFGQQSNIFSQNQQNPFNAFQKPAQPAFGQPLGQQSGFGMTTQAGANNSFFTGNKPLFGNTTQSSFFTPSCSGGFIVAPQQQPMPNQPLGAELQSQPEFHVIVEQLYEPFPYRDLFNGIEVKNYVNSEATNPTVLRKIIEDAPLPMTPSVDMSKLRIMPQPKLNISGNSSGRFSLLENTVSPSTPQNNFVLQGSTGKRLVLRKTTPKSEKDLLEHYKSMAAGGDSKNKSLFKNNIFEELNATNADSSNFENPLKPVTPPSVPPKSVLTPRDMSDGADKTSSFLEKSGKSVRFTDEDFDVGGNTSPVDNLQRHVRVLEGGDALSISNKDRTSSSTEESPSPISSREPQYPCGIKLTNPEYYTIPPYEELHKYKTENNACIIKGFTVGRHGFGSVYFPDQIDISNLDLDEIVTFGFRNVSIYSDDTKKPPIGQGLNRPAKVTLEHVWPRRRDTHEMIKDPKEIAAENFIERLAILSEKQNAELVDYRPETGSWVFTVKHFSKYYFTDADDEEIAKQLVKGKQEQERKEKESEKKTEESLSVFESEDEDQIIAKKGLGGMSYEMGDFTREASFHQTLTREKLTSGLRDDTKSSFAMRSSFFDEESISDDVSSSDIGIVHHFSVPATRITVKMMSDAQRKAKMPDPKYYSLHNQSHIVPLQKSLLASNNYMDVGLFKGRSFKVGWGSGFMLTVLRGSAFDLDPSVIDESPDTPVSSTVMYLEIGNLASRPQRMYLGKHLDAIFEESRVTVDSSGVPLFKIDSGYRTILRHREIAGVIDQERKIDVSYYKEIWDLCWALWGPEATSPTNRWRLFSKWLETAVTPQLRKDLELHSFKSFEPSMKSIFTYLTGHQVQKAAELAMEKGYPRLSALIAQSSAHEYSKLLVCKQLQQWKTNGLFDIIDKNILRVYLLLGGVSCMCDINIFDDLDWKRALALHLWYISPPGRSLVHAVKAYQENFTTLGYANRPIPEGYEFSSTTIYDILYHILLLFSTDTMPLEKVIDPTTYTEDPLDYRLSWLMLQLFSALQVGMLSQEVTNSLHTSFASQLESLGLWKWAIFVLLFIEDTSSKQNMIMGILDRNLDADRTEENLEIEDSLVIDFRIPPKWIHSVLANKTNLMQNHIETYQHMILKHDFHEANNIALTDLIPELISSGQCEKLTKLLNYLVPGMRDILNWSTQTGLVLDFLNLYHTITQRETATRVDIQILKNDLTGLCDRVKDFPTILLKQKLAIAELSRFIAILLKIVYHELEPTKLKNVEQAAELMKILIMPFDYKYHELTRYITLYSSTVQMD